MTLLKSGATRRLAAGALALLMIAVVCSGCTVLRLFRQASNMPFNGNVTFHEISVEIPSRFIRDSTQSNETYWFFEHGWGSEVITLMYKESAADLESYRTYLEEQGFEAEDGTFINCPAVKSEGVDKNGKTHREMFFIYKDHSYAVALTGGTEEEFQDLYNSVMIPE